MIKVDLSGASSFFKGNGPDYAAVAEAHRMLTDGSGKGNDFIGWLKLPQTILETELQQIVAPLEVREGEQDFSCLKQLYSRADVFGVNLYEAGLGEKIESMAAELFAGPGAVRSTLHKYVSMR